MNRWLAGRVFWPLTERFLRRDTMRRMRELQRTDTWSADALLVLQKRMAVLPGGRQHVLRSRAQGNEPRALHYGQLSLCCRESVGYGAGARCSGREDDCAQREASQRA